MKKNLFFLLFLSGNLFAQIGVIQFTNLGNSGSDVASRAIKTSDGNIVILGHSTSTTGNFIGNHGGKDIYIMKTDTAGVILWTKVIGGSSDETPVEIFEKQDGSFAVMCNTNSVDGDFTPPNVNYLTWTTTGPNRGGFVVFDLSSDGSSISNVQFIFHHTSSSIKPEGLSMTLLSNNVPLFMYRHSLQGGYHILNANQIINSYEFGSFCGRTTSSKIEKLSDNGYLSIGSISGATSQYNRPYGFNGTGCVPEDIFLVKYNSSGNLQWTKNYGGTGYDYGVDFVESNGYLYLIGNTNSNDYDIGQNLGSMDTYLAKLDLSGNLIKDTTFASSGRDIVNRIKVSNSGNIQIAGFSNNSQIQFYELNSNLNVVQSLQLNSPNLGNSVKDFLEINDKLYFITESSTQGPVGGGVNQGENSNSDIFLLKLGDVPPLFLTTLTQTNYCVGQFITVNFTSTLPSGSNYTAQLYKGQTLISSNSSSSSPINLYIPYSSSFMYGDDYYVKVISGNLESNDSDFLTIGNLASYNSNNKFLDENDNIITNINLCSGKSRTIKYIAHKLDNSISTDPISYIRSLNGTPLDTNTTGIFDMSNNGNYIIKAVQGSCNSSKGIYTNVLNNVSNYISQYGHDAICSGQTRKLVSNYYSSTAQFQWYLNNTPLPNGNSFEYNATQTGTYRVNVTESGCNIYPANSKLSFTDALAVNLNLSNNDSTICNGSYKNMYVNTYQYDQSQNQYQWYKNGQPIPGAINSVYGTNQPGKYYLILKQGACESRSKIINLISSTKSQKPNFSDFPYSEACSGHSVRLQEVKNSSYGNYLENTYRSGQWYKDGVKKTTFNSFYYDAAETGAYKMVIDEGNSCEVESDPIQITIGQLPKPLIQEYQNRTTICGNNLSLSFQSTGLNHDYNLTYQWKLNGSNLINENGPYLYPYNNSGAYSLVLTQGNCSMESDPINVTQTASNLTLVTSNSNLECTNALTKISIKEMSSYGYFNGTSWYKDGILIPNEKEPSIYVSQPGSYSATQNAGCFASTTTPLVIKSGPPSDYYAEAFDTVPEGQSAEITISNCPGEVKWYDDDLGTTPIFTGAVFNSPNLSSTISYWVSCEKDYCESEKVEVIVYVLPSCPDHILHSGTITGQLYKASQTITSAGDVETNTIYKAGNHINLSPGFQAGSNEVFEALIGGCEN